MEAVNIPHRTALVGQLTTLIFFPLYGTDTQMTRRSKQQTNDYDFSSVVLISPLSSQHRQYHLPSATLPAARETSYRQMKIQFPGTIYTSVPIPVGEELEKLLLDT